MAAFVANDLGIHPCTAVSYVGDYDATFPWVSKGASNRVDVDAVTNSVGVVHPSYDHARFVGVVVARGWHCEVAYHLE